MLDNFKLLVDFDFVDIQKSEAKSKNPDNKDPYENMIFSGMASDSTEDAEGEFLDPKGFVFDRFLKSGLFNLDHLPSRSPVNKSRFWIGEPIDAFIKDGKFFVKGKLWAKSPEARAFWDKAKEMKESGSTRRPGMSVEGKALERDKKDLRRITKALITNVALTMVPVNPSTYLDIEKSRGAKSFEELELQKSMIIYEYETSEGILRIDRDLKVSLEKSQKFDVDSFWTIYNAVQRGEASPIVLEELKNKFA